MLILVVNCGSSSLKYELFDMEAERSLSAGTIDRIGDENSSRSFISPDGEKIEVKEPCEDHVRAVELVKDFLTDASRGLLGDISEVAGIGHRVVHGGNEFSSSVLVDQKVVEGIKKFARLAPLHNPPALEGIMACDRIFQEVPQVAVFDTAFHQTIPEKAFMYGLPYDLYERHGIRRYGFHGTSHRYVSLKAAELLGRNVSDINLITVHLGNGCSMTAVEKGKSVETSMGFTPLEGLLMGTRSGDIDPAAVIYLMDTEGLSAGEALELLNKKSGLLGISGSSNDMRDILEGLESGDEKASLAYEVFVHRIIKYTGAYAAVLRRVDAVVFTGGVGENVSAIKERVKENLSALIGPQTHYLTVATNEELLIARDTYAMVRTDNN